MKKILSLALIAATLSVVFLSSCKKKEQLDSQTQQFNTDQNTVRSESDQSNNDINTTISTVPDINGRVEAAYGNFVCGVSVDSTNKADKIIIFKFDSVTSCLSPSRIRSGKIKVQLTSGNHWADAGAVLTITYENYKVLFQSNNTSITFNGTKTLTNVNGNDWWDFLLNGKSLIYHERTYNLQVTFNGGQTASWNSDRTTTWTYSNSNGNLPALITFSAYSDTSVNGYSNVDSWGTDRYGQSFTIHYNSPVVSNTYCGLWRFLSGVLVYHLNGNDYTLTLGVDTKGNPITNTDDCAYGFKVSWEANSKTQTYTFSY